MSDDEPRQPRTVQLEARMTARSSMRVEVIVVSLGQLPDALKNDPRELFVKAPTWWPHILLFLFALLVLLQLSVPSILAFKGLARGYNVGFARN